MRAGRLFLRRGAVVRSTMAVWADGDSVLRCVFAPICELNYMVDFQIGAAIPT